MTSTGIQPLSPEQAWITAEGARLYGKEAEQYLQARISIYCQMFQDEYAKLQETQP